PLHKFTIIQDLERCEVRVFGMSPLGFFRYRLTALSENRGLLIKVEKTPSQRVPMSGKGEWLLDGEVIAPQRIDSIQTFSPPELERLSLGNHRAQDLDLIRRRKDLSEILPIWHRLGQMVVFPHHKCLDGSEPSDLLGECYRVMSQNRPEQLEAPLYALFLAGF